MKQQEILLPMQVLTAQAEAGAAVIQTNLANDLAEAWDGPDAPLMPPSVGYDLQIYNRPQAHVDYSGQAAGVSAHGAPGEDELLLPMNVLAAQRR